MAWQDEKKVLLATIRRQEQEAAALARRFKRLQQTLEQQQQVLDRYERALDGARASTATPRAEGAVAAPTDDRRGLRPPLRSNEVVKLCLGEGKCTSTAQQTAWDKCNVSTPTDAPVPTIETKRETTSKKAVVETKQNEAVFKSVVKKRRNDEVCATWADEKQTMHRTTTWEHRLERAATGPLKRATVRTEPLASKESMSFPYIEVVRNREARKALPGHDCTECKKYYDALAELGAVDVAAQKHNCSRHRARFEPYQTPDDFWRLSFPDSELQ
ncbi:unnamed protein product [Hyaloperonospora brassicae]|uniref:DNA endonuclease activator Ctp1 C-terminal domain-containing protein n=1 Tax=Hyaloperonospora brassicae TaxID=162125 RepID=A0AAV0TFD3_HYABA|nr:unnamed protein product [Hyaloperonospora brassicae]